MRAIKSERERVRDVRADLLERNCRQWRVARQRTLDHVRVAVAPPETKRAGTESPQASSSSSLPCDEKKRATEEEVKEEVYVLECAEGRYYCGETKDVERRFDEHARGTVPWTRRYRPLRVIERRRKTGPFDELTTTLVRMSMHGIDVVRGETYNALVLGTDQRVAIQAHLDAARKACFRCHLTGHFVSHCPHTSAIPSNTTSTSSRSQPLPGRSSLIPAGVVAATGKPQCRRCGFTSHAFEACFAKIDCHGHAITMPKWTASEASNG